MNRMRTGLIAAGLVAFCTGASAQKLDESLFDGRKGSEFDLNSAMGQLLADLDERRSEQSGFQVSFQFSWMVAPEGFAYEDALNILMRTAEIMYPDWTPNQEADFSQSIYNSGLYNQFAQENRAARPWGLRLAWVSEDVLPVSLSIGAGQMGIDYYIEGRLPEDDVIGLNANQVRAVTFIHEYFQNKSDFGNVWNFPDMSPPPAFGAYYLEAGIGKRVHPLASLFVHYRQPVGVGAQVRSDLLAENTAFDNPVVTIRDGAAAHFGPIFTIQAQYHGRFMEWGIERVVRTTPYGSWPDNLISNGAIPFDGRSHTELSVGLRF